MSRLILLGKAALFLLLISISTTASAQGWGWGLWHDADVLPVVGEVRGHAYWMVYDVGEGPCAGFAPVPDPIPPISVPPTFANIQSLHTSTGVIQRLGKIVFDGAHCAEGADSLDGTFTIYAVHGTIEGIYEAGTLLISPPPEPPLFLPAAGSVIVQEGVYEITGGTGRFENVSGRLPFHVFIDVGEYGYAAEMTWSVRQVIAGHIQFPE